MWRERGADGMHHPNRYFHRRVFVLTYLVLMKVTGLFGFMMDVMPNSQRCIYELLVKHKEWNNVPPMEFVVSAMSLDKEIENGGKMASPKILNTIDIEVKAKERVLGRPHMLWSGTQNVDGEKRTLDFQYHENEEAQFCFINMTKRKIRVRLDFRFVTREKTASSIREGRLQHLETLLNRVNSAANYISAQLHMRSMSEKRLFKYSLTFWTRRPLDTACAVIVLVTLGIWQVLVLRRFFKNKKLV